MRITGSVSSSRLLENQDFSRTRLITSLETHQFVIGGVGVIIGVRLGHAHGHTVGKYGEKNENIKGLEDPVKGPTVRKAPRTPRSQWAEKHRGKDISTPPGPAQPCGWGC